MPTSGSQPDRHLSALSVDDCPLVAKAHAEECARVVALYNEVLEFYDGMLAESTPQQRTDTVGPFAASFKKIHTRLTRERYQVGFLGPFQGGKSSTFNKILSVVSEEEAPAKGGDGNATTAAITRLVASDGPLHKLKLRYLLESEFQTRKAGYCESLDIPAGTPDLEITRQIGERLRSEDRQSVLRQLKHLQRFMMSGKTFRSKLKAGPDRLEEEAVWDNRGVLLNHPPADAIPVAAASALLESAFIEYRTKEIPRELEMVDLPGLGSVNTWDDKLTWGYIEQLDGAFVFCEAHKLQEENVQKFLETLMEHWRSLSGRAWLCYTKSDTLTETHFAGNYFHNVRAFADSLKLPKDQICWLCNKPERLQEQNRQQAQLESANMAPLAKAWEALFDGGGVPRLSRLIKAEVPRLVGQGILAEADRELRKIGRELVNLAKVELSQGAGSDEEELNFAQRCLNRVHRIAERVATDNLWMGEAAEVLRQELGDAFTKLELEPQVLNHGGRIGERFPQHAGRLETTLHRSVRKDLTERAYQDVLPQLQDLEQVQRMRLPRVADEGLAEAWDLYRQADKSDSAWHDSDFPSFMRNNLFENVPDSENPLDGQEYVELFQEKIQVVSRQAVQKLRRRIQERLSELIGALDDYSSRSTSEPLTVRSAEFQKLMAEFASRFTA